ncbi:uncharacterized protein LOC142324409 [Lycorma delicatula]|uniref:uncharacterized protein LOC142324409 n=1 Tax=Lycorma delicatula TaxID=130591 RepID=UPI003F50D877
MVYPDDFIASEHGTRDVIDNDVPVPFVITVIRHGSNDHIHPNFPTPGQIRSMFNTSKISECPEYATSPSTMSDPLEWRPQNQMEVLEERLLRMHQWVESSSFHGHFIDFNTLINERDTDICEKIHELCLKLKDIIVLKEEINSKDIREHISDIENFNEIMKNRSGIKMSITNNEANENMDPCLMENKDKSEKISDTESVTSNKEEIPKKNVSVREINTSKESLESLIQFSITPDASQASKVKIHHPGINSPSQHNNKNNLPKKNIQSTRICIKPKQPDNTGFHASKSNKEEGLKNLKTKSKKLSQSLHKEEIVKKATQLGLLDAEENIMRVPHLTERAQLALLEKQIQGKMKIRQLGLERKKPDQREKTYIYKENEQNNSSTIMKNKFKENIISNNSDLKDSDFFNSPYNVLTKSKKESNIRSNACKNTDTMKSREIINKLNDVFKACSDKHNSIKEICIKNVSTSTSTTESSSFDEPQYLNEDFSSLVQEEVILKDITNEDNNNNNSNNNNNNNNDDDTNNNNDNEDDIENHEQKKDNKEIVTSFIASKERLDKWDSDILPSLSMERCVNTRLSSERTTSRILKFLFFWIPLFLFSLLSAVLVCQCQPSLDLWRFLIDSSKLCYDHIQEIPWKEVFIKIIDDIHSKFQSIFF